MALTFIFTNLQNFFVLCGALPLARSARAAGVDHLALGTASLTRGLHLLNHARPYLFRHHPHSAALAFGALLNLGAAFAVAVCAQQAPVGRKLFLLAVV